MTLASKQSLNNHRCHPTDHRRRPRLLSLVLYPSFCLPVFDVDMWPSLCLKSGSHSRDLQRIWSPVFTLKQSDPPGILTSLRTVPCLVYNVKSSPILKSFHVKKRKTFSNFLLKYLPSQDHLVIIMKSWRDQTRGLENVSDTSDKV